VAPRGFTLATAERTAPTAVGSSERLCENSSTTQRAEKAALTFSLWRIFFIFSEGDSNRFFVLQND
jgi:hypothetical protein